MLVIKPDCARKLCACTTMASMVDQNWTRMCTVDSSGNSFALLLVLLDLILATSPWKYNVYYYWKEWSKLYHNEVGVRINQSCPLDERLLSCVSFNNAIRTTTKWTNKLLHDTVLGSETFSIVSVFYSNTLRLKLNNDYDCRCFCCLKCYYSYVTILTIHPTDRSIASLIMSCLPCFVRALWRPFCEEKCIMQCFRVAQHWKMYKSKALDD